MCHRALESSDFDAAVEAYTAALAVDPQHKHVNKELQLGLCKVQQQMGKGDEAVQVRGLCCGAIGGMLQPPLLLLRRLLVMLGCRPAVKRASRQAVVAAATAATRLHPRSYQALSLPEAAFYQHPLRCVATARTHTQLYLFTVACLLTPTHPPTQACQAALAIEPQWLEASMELIRAMLAAKRHDEAVVKARELLQQHQQNGEVHQVRSEGRSAAGRWEVAEVPLRSG